MEDLLLFIASADKLQLEKILDAAEQRWKSLFPDWELNYLAIPKHDGRKEAIEAIVSFLNGQK